MTKTQQVETILEKKYKFFSEGIILGNYWGGGRGSYSARKMNADTLEELMAKNKEALKNGSLDYGMGFESLCGALIIIKRITSIVIDGETFTSSWSEGHFIGTLTEEDQEFLNEVYWGF